jgi:phospholipid/cholesterol/gamma-HCH transport system substrate-binding protein
VGSINSTAGRLATVANNITPDLQEFVGRQPGFLDYGLHDGRQRFAYMAANLPFLIKGLARITQEGSYMNAYACDVDFALWRGLFHWFRAFVAWTTPGNETKHTQMCR